MLDEYEQEELAWLCLGFKPESVAEIMAGNCNREEEFTLDLDSALERKFGCDFPRFCDLIEVLLPMTPLAESPITGEKFHAFIADGCAVVKVSAGEPPAAA